MPHGLTRLKGRYRYWEAKRGEGEIRLGKGRVSRKRWSEETEGKDKKKRLNSKEGKGNSK